MISAGRRRNWKSGKRHVVVGGGTERAARDMWREEEAPKSGKRYVAGLWWEEEAYILARVVPTSLSSCESRGVVQESREPVRALLDPGPSCPAVGSRRSGSPGARQVLRAL